MSRSKVSGKMKHEIPAKEQRGVALVASILLGNYTCADCAFEPESEATEHRIQFSAGKTFVAIPEKSKEQTVAERDGECLTQKYLPDRQQPKEERRR